MDGPAQPPPERALRLRVGGRVQGVGFRYHVQRAARRYGVRGFVRNLPDGDVEVVVEGPTHAVEELVQAVETGPSWSRVERVDKQDLGSAAGHEGFEIRY